MRCIIVSIFLALTFLVSPAMSEIIAVTDTVNQTFGGGPSPDDTLISVIMPGGLHGDPVRACVGLRTGADFGAVPVS